MKKTLHALPLSLALSAALAVGTIALSPAVALADGPQTNGILVTLQAPSPSGVSLLAQADSALDAAGVEVTGIVSSEDGTVTVEAQPASGQTDEQALAAARAVPGVESAQLNYVYHLIDAVEDTAYEAARETAVTPRETGRVTPLATSLLGIAQQDQFLQGTQIGSTPNQYWTYNVGLDKAWEQAQSNNAVTIVTLDSGVKLDHPDLADNLLAEYAWDVTNNVSEGGQPLQKTAEELGTADQVGHGTLVAGIAAAVTGNGGMAGASYNANVLPVKVIPNGSKTTDTATLARGYRYVLEETDYKALNVRVFNLSLGRYVTEDYDDEDAQNDRLLHEWIVRAYNEGIVTVCSGGNGNGTLPYSAALYPSDFEECVSVTALEADGTNIPWSDYNPQKDISAPGRTIWSTHTTYSETAGGYYSNSFSGTSLSAPIVSGTIALMCYVEPSATVDELTEALYATATPVTDEKNDRTQPDNEGVVSGSHGALSSDDAVTYIKRHVNRFNDVTEGVWPYDAVVYVDRMGIMNGQGGMSGNFGASADLARQDAAQLLYNYLGNGEDAPACGFSDVDQSAYCAKAVNWCVAEGIFDAPRDEQSLFGVGQPITREQLMTVLYRYAGTGETVDHDVLEQMPDHAQTSDWAVDGASWAVANGVVEGASRPDGTRVLDPQANVSRAVMAQIVMNAIEGGIL